MRILVQRIILLLGVLVFSADLMFPPWARFMDKATVYQGRRFLLRAPQGTDLAVVNVAQWGIELAGIVAIVVGITLALRSRSSGGDRA